MDESNVVIETKNEMLNIIKKSIIRLTLIIVSTIVLVILINYKKAVNNEITNIYYIVSIVGSIVSVVLFGIMFIKNLSLDIKRKFFGFLDLFYIFTLACAAFQMFFAFGYFKANVDGTSMVPTFYDNQVLIVRSSNNNVDNGDVVVAMYDEKVNNYTGGLNTGDLLVKRVVAKAGDTFYFDNGVLWLNGVEIKENYIAGFSGDFDLSKYESKGIVEYNDDDKNYYICDGYYFLMGDNRSVSNDSRQLGLFKKEQIVGEVNYELHGIFDWERVG